MRVDAYVMGYIQIDNGYASRSHTFERVILFKKKKINYKEYWSFNRDKLGSMAPHMSRIIYLYVAWMVFMSLEEFL
jgi:hypothetical protein